MNEAETQSSITGKWKNAKVGVLLGGLNAEREISISSGEAIFEALKARGYQVEKILVDTNVDVSLRRAAVDVAFIALHGTFGEDGCVQGLLEIMSIPYTGSPVLASALSMDKVKSKELFRLYNVPTPAYYTVRKSDFANLEETHGSFGYPAFVKPRRSGSSVGAGQANTLSELRQRCEAAAQFDSDVLVERYVAGKEIAVGVIDGKPLSAIEIEPKGNFYDYQSKYSAGQSQYHFPARLTSPRYEGVLNIAERACRALGATSAARVDLLVTDSDNEYVLEVNTIPGFTPTSLLPKIAAGCGFSFGELCELILDGAALHTPQSQKQR